MPRLPFLNLDSQKMDFVLCVIRTSSLSDAVFLGLRQGELGLSRSLLGGGQLILGILELLLEVGLGLALRLGGNQLFLGLLEFLLEVGHGGSGIPAIVEGFLHFSFLLLLPRLPFFNLDSQKMDFALCVIRTSSLSDAVFSGLLQLELSLSGSLLGGGQLILGILE